jgi:predicted nuclease of restriction endonuclease-like (RecB) superfamily
MTEPLAPDSYAQFLADLKRRIQTAQLHASLAVNRELVLLYWQIGRDILDRQKRESWGTKVIDRLAADLKRAFPDMKGFSPRNLKYMRAFAEAWPDEAFVQAMLAQITWYHNLAILEKLASADDRVWYAKATIQHGWSRNVLVHQIEAGRRHRQGKAVANFDRTLPSPESDLAQDITKDPYNFDFLTLGDDAHERDLERGLLDYLRQFLLELGVGFAFVGSQYRLTVGHEEFYIDLLFYHLKLRAYVVVDLKMKAFEPEFAGKMNFYLSAVMSTTSCAIRTISQVSASSFAKPGNDSLPNTRSATSTNRLAYPNTSWPKVFLKNCREACPPLRNWRMNWGRHPKRNPYDSRRGTSYGKSYKKERLPVGAPASPQPKRAGFAG